MSASATSAWTRIELENVTREYRTPRILEEKITVNGYDGKLRQFAVRDLGHEFPTIIMTNQMRPSAAVLIQRYARRMTIEQRLADIIKAFHADAL